MLWCILARFVAKSLLFYQASADLAGLSHFSDLLEQDRRIHNLDFFLCHIDFTIFIFLMIYLTLKPRPIKRRLVSVFHETEMKIWAGQIFLAAHTVLPN